MTNYLKILSVGHGKRNKKWGRPKCEKTEEKANEVLGNEHAGT